MSKHWSVSFGVSGGIYMLSEAIILRGLTKMKCPEPSTPGSVWIQGQSRCQMLTMLLFQGFSMFILDR